MHDADSQSRDRLAAREAVEVPWDELREARNLKEVLAARARERRSGDAALEPEARGRSVWFAAAAVGLAVGLGALALVVLGMRANRSTVVEELHAAADPVDEDAGFTPVVIPPNPGLVTDETSVLTLPDGGHVRLQAGAQIELLEEGIVQRSGRVHYTITRELARPLEIELGKVVLRVGAAVFEAEIDVHHVELIVFAGRVELHEDGRAVVLERGGEAHIPRDPLTPAELQPEHEKPRPVQPAGPSATELMRRADLARAEGRLDDAVVELQTLVERHSQSPLVGAALLTIARLESKRGRYETAAAAFAEHSLRFPNDPLAEDALAGAATQSALAGATPRAREHAQDYLERFPTGIHRAAMLQLLAHD
jgi:hypothetical protein